jgi:TPR repeat protein
MNTRRAIFAALALAVIPISASAQDFAKGASAYRKGDFETAAQEWRPLAEQGDARAQYFLGRIYDNGEGIPEDDAEAVRWYRLAAEQGDARAQYFLGRIYDNGEGVRVDDVEALRWYRLAADQGDTGAQSVLGVMYARGEGVLKDYVSAHMWFNIARANGAENVSEALEGIQNLMTASEISEAQARTRVCFASGYKDCGG